MLEVVDDGNEDTENVLAPEDVEDTHAPHVSLHSLTGICTGQTMQLGVKVGTKELLALVDSGFTHNFIRDDVIGELGLKVQPRHDMKLTIANGKKMTSAGIVHELPVHIG